MKFSKDPLSQFSIRKVAPGAIVVGERTLGEPFTLLHDRLLPDWPGRDLQALDLDYLQPVLEREPELLLIGTGWTALRPPRDVLFGLARRGVGLEVMDTPAACRTFNILLAEDRRPAAIIYVDDPSTDD